MAALQVPSSVSKVPSECLNPENMWKDKANFKDTLTHLAQLYQARL